MKTNMLSFISQLTNRELLARVKRLVQSEREATAELIGHLAEIEERNLHLDEGYSSLYKYCTQALHLSEHEAYVRIYAARMARRFPRILEILKNGDVTLTTVRLLGPLLTHENHVRLLEEAKHKSRDQVEELVARVRPQPDAPSSIRKLPDLNLESTTPAELANAESNFLEVTAPIANTSSNRLVPTKRSELAKPLSPGRYKIQFTANDETYQELRRAQELMRHQNPTGDLGAILALGVKLVIKQLEKQRLGLTDRPRKSRGTAPGSRDIPAAVRRFVWKRDGGQCAFVSPSGNRCDEIGFLQFHHVWPHGDGGPASMKNIELRCRPHNLYEADLYYGARRSPGVGDSFVREAAAPWIKDLGWINNSVRTSNRVRGYSVQTEFPRRSWAEQAAAERGGERGPLGGSMSFGQARELGIIPNSMRVGGAAAARQAGRASSD